MTDDYIVSSLQLLVVNRQETKPDLTTNTAFARKLMVAFENLTLCSHVANRWFPVFVGHGTFKKPLMFCGTSTPPYNLIEHSEPRVKLLAPMTKLFA